MGRRRTYLELCLAFLAGCLAAAVLSAVRTSEGNFETAGWELKDAVLYDENLLDILEQMNQEGIDTVFWQESKEVTVTNPDYSRSIEGKTVGVAGDCSILFPNANGLSCGETGYCLLGETAAQQLFGSTKVVGRSVLIEGRSYRVAGIEYREKELCIYELTPGAAQEVAYAAVRYESRSQKDMRKRRLEQAGNFVLAERSD